MEKTYEIRVFGKVQGVGYRNYVNKIATSKNIKGKIENKEDGSVSIFACMKDDFIDSFVDDLKVGNTYSKVSCIKVEEVEDNILDDYKDFFIAY